VGRTPRECLGTDPDKFGPDKKHLRQQRQRPDNGVRTWSLVITLPNASLRIELLAVGLGAGYRWIATRCGKISRNSVKLVGSQAVDTT